MTFFWDIQHFPSPAAFAAHLARLPGARLDWAIRIVYHHTYRPTISQWRGRTSMESLGRFYRAKGWRGGPHLFIGPDGIWQGTPLSAWGIHAGECNDDGWGIEVVGDYDLHPWAEPIRGLALAAGAALLQRRGLGVSSQTVTGHRFCLPNKSCPGWAVNLDKVRAALALRLSPQRYRARAATAWHEDRRHDAPVALGGAATIAAGTPVVIDDIYLGWGHHAGGIGFVSMDDVEPA